MPKKKFNKSTKNSSSKKKICFKSRLPRIIKRINRDTFPSYKNPRITSIQSGYKFIYDLDTFIHYFSSIEDKNSLKLKTTELDFLKEKINELKFKNDINPLKIINIPYELFSKISTFCPKIDEKDEAVLYIKKLIESQREKGYLSCRRIAHKYFEDTGKKISKTKVNNIMRNKLGLKFLKTTIKNNKINCNKNILISLCFIKIIVKCLKQKFHLIFVDESIIQPNNNNFKIWRWKNETITYNLGSRKRKNLLAAVDLDSVIYYKINDENTDEKQFLLYMQELKTIIEKKKFEDYAIIMDNLSCHKTQALKKFYADNKINVIFTSPYQSSFNSIELFFRLIKKRFIKICIHHQKMHQKKLI